MHLYKDAYISSQVILIQQKSVDLQSIIYKFGFVLFYSICMVKAFEE